MLIHSHGFRDLAKSKFFEYKKAFKKIFLKNLWFQIQGQPKTYCKPAQKSNNYEKLKGNSLVIT